MHRKPRSPGWQKAYGKLPLSFEINRGQTDPQVKFLSRGNGYSLFLTGNEAVLSLKKPGARSQKSVARPFRAARPGSADLAFKSAAFPGLLRSPVEINSRTADPKPGSALQEPVPNPESRTSAMLRMKLVGANPQAKVERTRRTAGQVQLLHRQRSQEVAHQRGELRQGEICQDVYPGVDLVYYGNQRQLEYDFVVQPGADPRQIALDVGAGLAPPERAPQAAPLRVDRNGDLVVGTEGGEVIFHKPVVYQPGLPSVAGSSLVTRHSSLVEGRYRLERENHIRFEVGPYDHSKPLVIDPVLVYSTYLGGSGRPIRLMA